MKRCLSFFILIISFLPISGAFAQLIESAPLEEAPSRILAPWHVIAQTAPDAYSFISFQGLDPAVPESFRVGSSTTQDYMFKVNFSPRWFEAGRVFDPANFEPGTLRTYPIEACMIHVSATGISRDESHHSDTLNMDVRFGLLGRDDHGWHGRMQVLYRKGNNGGKELRSYGTITLNPIDADVTGPCSDRSIPVTTHLDSDGLRGSPSLTLEGWDGNRHVLTDIPVDLLSTTSLGFPFSQMICLRNGTRISIDSSGAPDVHARLNYHYTSSSLVDEFRIYFDPTKIVPCYTAAPPVVTAIMDIAPTPDPSTPGPSGTDTTGSGTGSTGPSTSPPGLEGHGSPSSEAHPMNSDTTERENLSGPSCSLQPAGSAQFFDMSAMFLVLSFLALFSLRFSRNK